MRPAPPDVSFDLGPFVFDAPIGRGGMGEVWRGRHRAENVPVAVKVLTAERARQERFRRAFRAEVRAAAGLDHPHIAQLYDHGEIPETLSQHLPFQPGSPYLVMELVTGGSLRGLCGRLSWDAVGWVLLALLDALAYAHARGVVHRDLKPENVLLGAGRPLVKLTDFGLACPIEDRSPEDRRESREQGRFAGTPTTMAPEQVEGRWRDYGPWTDLYGLGCLAFALVSGGPPFPGPGLLDVLEGHLHRPVPPLSARVSVPAGFEAWVLTLLEKDAARRFQRAADAAAALRSLAGLIDRPALVPAELFPPERDDSLRSDSRSSRFSPTPGPQSFAPKPRRVVPALSQTWSDTWSDTWEGVLPPGMRAALAMVPTGPVTGEDETQRVRVPGPPPLPASWRRATDEAVSAQPLGGVGLALFGLRNLPLVGRESERDQLWEALREVGARGRSQAVVVSGPEGVGKSRLVEVMSERASEVGAAQVFRVVYRAEGGTDGLGPMVARAFRATGLPRMEVLLRVRARLKAAGLADSEEDLALTELISPATEAEISAERRSESRAVRLGSAEERYVVVRRVLERASAERPVILWLDEAGSSREALEFANHLLDAQDWEPFPALILLTVSDAPGPEAAALSALLARTEVSRCVLGPLGAEARAALVRGLLGLEDALAAEVEERSAGNPQFALQLLGDWVERGLLESGPRGFRLRADSNPDLPPHLRQIWEDRLSRALEGASTAEASALELAAVLGQDVRAEEWRAACAAEGLDPAPALVERLLEGRLARPSEEGMENAWSFDHALIREALVERARTAGRLPAHHRAAAAALAGRRGGEERLARHLLAAGDTEAALAPLATAIRGRVAVGDYPRAAALLSAWDRALDGMALPKADPRWGEGWLMEAAVDRLEGRLSEARALADRVARHSHANGWESLRPRAIWEQARAAWNLGEADDALRLAAAAIMEAEAQGEVLLAAECSRDLGLMESHRGAYASAAMRLRAASAAFEAYNNLVGEGYCALSLGQNHQRLGELDEAETVYQRALVRFTRAGARRGVADCENSLGEVARLRGDLAGAETLYRASRDRYHAIGSGLFLAPEGNLGLVLVERGRYAEARQVLELTLAAAERQGRRLVQGNVHAYLLPSLAALGDWEGFAQHYEAAERILQETGIVEQDIARMAERASALAREAGHAGESELAVALAVSQWRGLGREADAARVRAEG